MVLPPLQQAQRRILEEQYAANPPAKASRGTAASVPPAAASRQAVKYTAPAPGKILEAVTTSEVISKAVTPGPEAAAALERSPTEVQAEAADVGAGETPVATETAEAAPEATPEAEAVLPDTEAGTQVRNQKCPVAWLKGRRRQRPGWREGQERVKSSSSAGSSQVAERAACSGLCGGAVKMLWGSNGPGGGWDGGSEAERTTCSI